MKRYDCTDDGMYEVAAGEWVRLEDAELLTVAEHTARCDLIDALGMLEVAIVHRTLTEAERKVFGEWLEQMRAKYPQQKAKRDD